MFANSQPSASNFISFSTSLEQFFLTVGENNFGNKIPDFHVLKRGKRAKRGEINNDLAVFLCVFFLINNKIGSALKNSQNVMGILTELLCKLWCNF